MASLIKNIITLVALVVTLYSCSQSTSLQKYFVDNQEKANFLAVDLPANILSLDESKLTEEQKEAYKSVKKLNMLAYRLDSTNVASYETELAKVKAILKDPKYNELMRGNTEEGKFTFNYIGDEGNIDELVLFGNANDKGFAIIRILGDDMNPSKIMQLSSAFNTSKMDTSQIGQFAEFFK
jgi:hypothetical protein